MISVHEHYIRRCFTLAKLGLGMTSPNPYVGAVIVKDGKVIAEGYHQKSGLPHAEIMAINNATEDVAGSTLYCNLEPCCHTNKKTPPCAQKIIELGIKEVIISNLDPNPEVAGKGIKLLIDAGIKVTSGILEQDGLLLNEVFFTHVTKKRPFIHLKWAQTLDGKIATKSNHSKWITNSSSRENSHKERRLYDAVLIGSTTANSDDPSLTIRLAQTTCTKRIILAPTLNLNKELKLFNDEYKKNTIIVTAAGNEPFQNIKTLFVPMVNGEFELKVLLKTLYLEGIKSIYVEGGMKTISSFIDAELYDRVSIYMAPKILGPGIGLQTHTKNLMNEAIEFSQGQFRHFQNDILFESARNVCLLD